jgi:hypothetical protein
MDMQFVRLHVDGSGLVWALTKCRGCGEVHKYQATKVSTGPVNCKSCKRQMEFDRPTIDAVAAADAAAKMKQESARPPPPARGLESDTAAD